MQQGRPCCLACLPLPAFHRLVLHSPLRLPVFQWASQSVKGLPKMREPFCFEMKASSCPDAFYFYFFIPFSYVVIVLTALVIRALLPVFSGYSVNLFHMEIFLMYLWEEMSSTSFYSAILISAPSGYFFACAESLLTLRIVSSCSAWPPRCSVFSLH